jgi:hypothetical protein
MVRRVTLERIRATSKVKAPVRVKVKAPVRVKVKAPVPVRAARIARASLTSPKVTRAMMASRLRATTLTAAIRNAHVEVEMVFLASP